MGPVSDLPDEPDVPEPNSGNPPSYVALRLANALYVEYKSGEHEYYNLVKDPYEIHNVYASLSTLHKAALHLQVLRLEACHNQPACSQVRAVAS